MIGEKTAALKIMNRAETILFIILLPFYFVAFGLHQFMIFAVNRKVDSSERIPHSLFWRGWNLVRDNYKRLYPKSSVHQLSLACAVTVTAAALALAGLRVWEYTHR